MDAGVGFGGARALRAGEATMASGAGLKAAAEAGWGATGTETGAIFALKMSWGATAPVALASADVLAKDARLDENAVGNTGADDGPPKAGNGAGAAFESWLPTPNDDSNAKLMPVDAAAGTGSGKPKLPLLGPLLPEEALDADGIMENGAIDPNVGIGGNGAGAGALVPGSGMLNGAPNVGSDAEPTLEGNKPEPNVRAGPALNADSPPEAALGALKEFGNAPKVAAPDALPADFRTLAMRRLANSESSATANDAG